MKPLALFVSCALCAACFAAERPSKPNIVYILADDLGYGDLSCYNEDSKIRTPQLVALAAEGMRFTDAHSGSGVCTPTRYGVVTGRYAWRSRLKKGVLGGASEHLIDPDRATVADVLKQQGYHTAMIGKWHLGWDFQFEEGESSDDFDFTPESRKIDYTKRVENGPDVLGFDYYYGHCGSLDMPPYVYVENGKVTATPNRITENRDYKAFWRKGPTGEDFVHDEVLPNFIDRACKYIEEKSKLGEPFFLYLPLPAPHTPILPTSEFKGKSGTNAYGDFVQQVDAGIGKIMETIDASGIDNNTLFVFTSDNGCSPRAGFEELAEVGHDPSYVYRGHKADIYEGGHRIPFIVRWPEQVAKGSVSSATTCLTDLMATVADITETDLAPDSAEDSVSLYPVLLGQKEQVRETVIHHSINGSFAIRKGPWKLIMCPGSGGWSEPRPEAAYKQGLSLVQLYNLETDPGEKNNIYQERPGVVKELYRALKSHVETGRSTPGPAESNEGETTFEPKGFESLEVVLE